MRVKLQERRKECGYSSKSMANALGISYKMYQFIEQGRRFPSERTLKLLFKLLKNDSIALMDNEEKIEKIGRGMVAKNIAELMNSTLTSEDKFNVYIISAIRRGIELERKDRHQMGISINSKTEDGRELINERIAKVVNEVYKLELTSKDIKLYRDCMRQEYTNRTKKCTWSIPKVRELMGFDPDTGKAIGTNKL